MKKKSLGVNAVLNGFKSVLSLIFPLITFPYVSRILSVDGMGIFNFANTYVNYFILIAGLGVATYAVREGAKYRDDREKFSSFASQVFTINIVSTIVTYMLLLISLMIFKSLHNYLSAILILSLQILFTTIGTEWVYSIYEDYSYITIRSIAFNILSTILLFVFVRDASDYLWYAGIAVLASVGSNILNCLHVGSFVKIKLVKQIDWKYHLKPIMIIFASTVAVKLYLSIDTILLGLMKDNYSVGIYSVAVKVYAIVSGLIFGLLIVTIPRLAKLLGQNRLKEYTTLLHRVINNVSIILLPTAIGLIILSKEIVFIIAGDKYSNSATSLQIIAIALVFSNFSAIFNQCVLIPAKRESKTLRNTLITVLANIALNLIIIPMLSYNGAALTTVIAEFLIMALNCKSVWDIVKPIVTSKLIIKNILDSLLGCVGIILVCLLFRYHISSMMLRTILSVVTSVGIYVVILFLLNNRVLFEFVNKAKRVYEKIF